MALKHFAVNCRSWWLHAKSWCDSDPERFSCKTGDRGHGSNVMGWHVLRKINECGHKLIVFLSDNQQVSLTLTFNVIKEYVLGSLLVIYKETEFLSLFKWDKISVLSSKKSYRGVIPAQVKAIFPSSTLTGKGATTTVCIYYSVRKKNRVEQK